jgi:L-amino acid N-acyltransferase YncA
MHDNYEAVGFLSSSAITEQYGPAGRYILQCDERGRRVGYLLHGALGYGRAVSIAQHCIDYDRRLRGYGETALKSMIERAVACGATAIRARCATDNESLQFWLAQGFVVRAIVPGGQRRQRQIAEIRLLLPLGLDRLDTEGS